MDSSLDVLLRLIRISLDLSSDIQFPSKVDWQRVFDLAVEQGMVAIAFDGIQKLNERGMDVVLPLYSQELKELKYDWFGNSLGVEVQYENHCKLVQELGVKLGENGIKTMVVKGIGLSCYYPIPSHRAVGDIDLYLFGCGGEADDLFSRQVGVTVKQNEDKHSTFKYKGTVVENHASFLNVVEYPSSSILERFLEKEASNSPILNLGQVDVYIPSVKMNSLYLPCHTAGHFMYGGLTLKQLTDWALFVTRFGDVIDWDDVYFYSRSVGFYRFLLALNGIVVDYFGVPLDVFPPWKRDLEIEHKVWEEILKFKSENDGSRFHRAMRFLSSKWKFDLVYRESFSMTFLKRCWASIRGKYLPSSRNVWS